jgi:hypothetical protein
MRSLALVEGEVTLVNTPFSFTMICAALQPPTHQKSCLSGAWRPDDAHLCSVQCRGYRSCMHVRPEGASIGR